MARVVGMMSRITYGRRVARAGELRRGGDAAAAVEELAKLFDEEPDDAAANVEMARALQVLGDASGSEEHYRRALAQSLDYRLVVELAGVVGQQGRTEEAEDLVAAALQMTDADPRLDPGEALLVRAAIAAGSGRVEDARAIVAEIEAESRAHATTKEYARRLREQLR